MQILGKDHYHDKDLLQSNRKDLLEQAFEKKLT
jgi:hypothetical protein